MQWLSTWKREFSNLTDERTHVHPLLSSLFVAICKMLPRDGPLLHQQLYVECNKDPDVSLRACVSPA